MFTFNINFIWNGERERGVFYRSNDKSIRGPNKVSIPKMWDVGEHKRKINTICCQPWKDIFVCYIDHNEKIQSNWHEKRFTVLVV